VASLWRVLDLADTAGPREGNLADLNASPQIEGMRVLVVDDNVGVRNGLAKVLRRAGFEVHTAGHGLEALAELEWRSFDAIVCDISMPVMDGMEFHQAMRERYPDMVRRILFVSAWSDDPKVQSFLDSAGCPVLAKPFEIAEFVARVKEVAVASRWP
jgi:two-component system cell cycle sensor histidine kinase/response regulator CckA